MTEVGELAPVAQHDHLVSREFLRPEEVVVIPDTGSQYGMDIEQQVKRLGHNAVRVPFDTPIEELYKFGAIILPGGPESVYDEASPKPDPRLFTTTEARPPVLGICYGAHLINHNLGGTVEKLDTREDGFMNISLATKSELLAGLGSSARFITTHGDTNTSLAPGLEPIAISNGLNAGFENVAERIYGVQFHPEVSPPAGTELLRNFLQRISSLEATYSYTYEEFIDDAIQEVRQTVGDKPVLAYISGGVDSAALAKLLERALPPEQISLVLVDHGFMRLGEVKQVVETLADANLHIQVYDASRLYKNATTEIDGKTTPPLSLVTDPEVKRKIIGDTFITIQKEMASELVLDPENYMLAMGTLHTDLIESGSDAASGKAAKIKSHHNDTEQVRRMREQGRVVEPWRFLQKDDVRAVAKLLGLPEEIYNRQPFPGPGLAIRVICAETPYIPPNHKEILEQLASFDGEGIVTSLLPVKTVGLQGDDRTYGHLVGLSGSMNWPKLKALANEIPNRVHDVNRVAYIFGSLVEAHPISITKTLLGDSAVPTLRKLDAIVNQKLEKHGLDKTLSQVPVILLPVDFGKAISRSVAIRTFKTVNFKTGDIALPGVDFPEDVLFEIVEALLEQDGISRVLYDLTSKPPGTTEWE